MATATCSYKACRCTRPYGARNLALSTTPTDPDAAFCSPRCETQAGASVSDDGCECGHPECTPQATADIPPMQ